MKKENIGLALISILVIIIIFCQACQKEEVIGYEGKIPIKAEKIPSTYEPKKTEETTEETTEYINEYVCLNESSFYEVFGDYQASWDDCRALAQEKFGMDEYNLRVCAGWLINEGYTECDPYLSYLCTCCCWYWWNNGNIANGLAGWDYSGTYDEGRLYELGFWLDQNETNILYLALKYPYYNIYGCDGVSWYHDYPYYQSWAGGYLINVWAE